MKPTSRANVLSIVFLAVFVLLSGAWFSQPARLQSLSSPAKSDDVNVNSNVPGLEIVDTKNSAGRFNVVVRNKSEKSINGFYVASGKESWQLELIYSDTTDEVPPSSEFNIEVPYNNQLSTNGLSIDAVLFERGGGAGNPAFVRLMLDRRHGEKQELIKGKRIWDELAAERRGISKEKLVEVKRRFIAEETEKSAADNESVKHGKHLGSQRFIKAIENLSKVIETRPANLEFEIGRMDSRLLKYVSKL